MLDAVVWILTRRGEVWARLWSLEPSPAGVLPLMILWDFHLSLLLLLGLVSVFFHDCDQTLDKKQLKEGSLYFLWFTIQRDTVNHGGEDTVARQYSGKT